MKLSKSPALVNCCGAQWSPVEFGDERVVMAERRSRARFPFDRLPQEKLRLLRTNRTSTRLTTVA
jgi:hypothetical protein